ncbi:MAG TPA: hypothetical protein VKE40_16950 [Gemmataceae bacterium]|nr:hypothetical protein [Gemmataceae bacterium]
MRSTILVSGTGVAEWCDDGAKPVWRLCGPVKPGAKWQNEEFYRPNPGRRTQHLVTVDRSVGAIEWVTVPAGRFRAARVDSVFTCNGEIKRGSHWYAPGVGLVKKDDGRSVIVLCSFTRGQK